MYAHTHTNTHIVYYICLFVHTHAVYMIDRQIGGSVSVCQCVSVPA